MSGKLLSMLKPLALLLLISGLANCMTGDAEPSMSKWELWSAGLHLRGANVYQRRVYPELDGNTFMGDGAVGPPFHQADFLSLAAMGANVVNISHPGIYAENPPYTPDPDILGNLENLVNMAYQADLFIIISFRTGPGRSEFTFHWGEHGDWFDSSYYNDRVWTDPGAQSAWEAMWRKTAERFKHHPAVVGYDLMVEPNANDVWFGIWDPELFYARYSGTLYDWNHFFPRIISSIRTVDQDTPILVESMSYGSVDWLPYLIPADDHHTLYAVHQYQPHFYTHQYPGSGPAYPGMMDADYNGEPEWVDRTWLDNLLEKVDRFSTLHSALVACNEFGVVRWAAGADRFMGDQMDLFEERSINHMLWEWAPDWPPRNVEVNAFNFRFGPDPYSTNDVSTSALIETIRSHWTRNSVRPSSVDIR